MANGFGSAEAGVGAAAGTAAAAGNVGGGLVPVDPVGGAAPVAALPAMKLLPLVAAALPDCGNTFPPVDTAFAGIPGAVATGGGVCGVNQASSRCVWPVSRVESICTF